MIYDVYCDLKKDIDDRKCDKEACRYFIADKCSINCACGVNALLNKAIAEIVFKPSSSLVEELTKAVGLGVLSKEFKRIDFNLNTATFDVRDDKADAFLYGVNYLNRGAK